MLYMVFTSGYSAESRISVTIRPFCTQLDQYKGVSGLTVTDFRNILLRPEQSL